MGAVLVSNHLASIGAIPAVTVGTRGYCVDLGRRLSRANNRRKGEAIRGVPSCGINNIASRVNDYASRSQAQAQCGYLGCRRLCRRAGQGRWGEAQHFEPSPRRRRDSRFRPFDLQPSPAFPMTLRGFVGSDHVRMAAVETPFETVRAPSGSVVRALPQSRSPVPRTAAAC